MKNIKKFVPIILALFVVVFLAGCGNKTEKENSFHKAFVGTKIASEYFHKGQSGLLVLEFSSKEDIKITKYNVDGVSTEVGKYSPTQDKVEITVGEKTTEYTYELFDGGVSLEDGQNGMGYHYFDYKTQINQTYYSINGDEFSVIDFTSDGVITETTYIKNSDDLPTVQTTNYFTHKDLMVLYSASDNQVSNEITNFTVREESLEVGTRPHAHTAKVEIEGDFYYYIVNEEEQMIEGLTFDKEGKMTITSTFVLKDPDDEYKSEVIKNQVEKKYFQVAQHLVTYELIEEGETQKTVFDWNTVFYSDYYDDYYHEYQYALMIDDINFFEDSKKIEGRYILESPPDNEKRTLTFESNGELIETLIYLDNDGKEDSRKNINIEYYIFDNIFDNSLISVIRETGEIKSCDFKILEDGNLKVGNVIYIVVED